MTDTPYKSAMVDYSESLIEIRSIHSKLETAFLQGTKEDQHKLIGKMQSELIRLNQWVWEKK